MLAGILPQAVFAAEPTQPFDAVLDLDVGTYLLGQSHHEYDELDWDEFNWDYDIDDEYEVCLFGTHGTWRWPVPNNRTIFSPFNVGNAVLQKKRGGVHNGIDISLNSVLNVVAARTGSASIQDGCNNSSSLGKNGISCKNRGICKPSTKSYSSGGNCNSGYGNVVFITHSNGYVSVYAHLATIAIRDGNVNQGTVLGTTGSTGSSSGRHLHFEILHNKKVINTNPVDNTLIKSNNTGTYSHAEIAWAGTVTYVNGNTTDQTQLHVPTISDPTNYFGGKTVTITRNGNPNVQNIQYRRNNGALITAVSPVRFDITSTEDITAHAQATGFANSPTTPTRKITVDRVATPVIRDPVYSETRATVEITRGNSNDIVLFTTTTNGTAPPLPTFDRTTGAPTGVTQRYGGAIPVTSGMRIRAIAIRSGLRTSAEANSTISLGAPDMPDVRLHQTATRIAVGDTATVNWSPVVRAVSYEAELRRNGELVRTEITNGNLASFTLPQAGVYEIRVRAKGSVGDSVWNSPAVSVEAMANIKVSFHNDDGTPIVPDRDIKYGEAPQYPRPNPTKRGHDFAGWTVSEGTALLADTVISATFTPQFFNVEFLNTDGRRIGNIQSIAYGQSAVVPLLSEITISPDHVFLGWNISFDSDGTDFMAVDGNMRIQATQTWENPLLPVGITITSATKNSAAISNDGAIRYTINVSLTSDGGVTPFGWLMTVLKTQEGRMVASKTDAIGIGAQTIVIDSDEVASIVEVVVVGRNGVATGGALSRLRTAPITESSGYVWGEWSTWSTTRPTGVDAVEEKRQFRFNTRETATSSTSRTPPSGFTFSHTVSTQGDWSAWSTAVATASNTDERTRVVETRSVIANYSMRYFRYQSALAPNPRWYMKDSVTPGTNGTRASYGQYSDALTWSTTTFDNAPRIANGATTSGSAGGVNRSGETGYTSPNATSGTIWFRVSTNFRTEYRFRDTTHIHHFFRITPWSDWQDNRPASFNALEERTVYRWRNRVPVSQATTGTGEMSGETYYIEGTLQVEADLFDPAGDGSEPPRVATIFVYKNTNTDPNEEQRQFVGQTTILPGNRFEFSFIPRERISAETGDYIVTLALEGDTVLTNLIDATIRAPRPSYDVVFRSDGAILGNPQKVLRGENAIVPDVPEKPGSIFVGWDESPSNITGNRTLNALFIPRDYVVVMVDFANADIEMETGYKYDQNIVLPELVPEGLSEGKTFIGWYTLVGETKVPVQDLQFTVTDHTLLIADWETAIYTVEFVDGSGTVISSQQIEHGESANPPAPLNPQNMIFMGWETDAVWWRVTGNVTVRPILVYPETVSAPTVEFPEDPGDFIVDDNNDQGRPSIIINIPVGPRTTTFVEVDGVEGVDYQIRLPDDELSLFSQGNEVIHEGVTHQFTSDTVIEIFADVTLTMLATATYGDMNDSEIVVIDIPFVNPWDDWEEWDDEYSMFLMTENVFALAGKQISIPVWVSSVYNIASMQIGLNFNTSILTLVDSIQGDAFEEDSENGLLITLIFNVASNSTPGKYEVIVSTLAKDLDDNDIEINPSVAMVTVYNPDDPAIFVSSGRIQQDGFVDVIVSLANSPGIAYYSLQLLFDRWSLVPVSITMGEAFNSGSLVSNIHAHNINYVSAVWFDTTGIDADGILFTVRFKVNDDARASRIFLPLIVVQALDKNGEDVNVMIHDGTIEPISFIPGNVTGSGTVDGRDIIYLQRHFAGWPGYELSPTQLLAADVNGDGVVDGRDLIYFARHFAGWPGYEVLGPR
jgi:hypothetical protein